MPSRIRAARQERGWSQSRLIGELELVAKRRSQTLPSRETLKSRVSRWENARARPDDFYRQLLREAFGLDDRELGFAHEFDESATPAADELRMRLSTTRVADGTLLESLRSQTEAIRRQDRQYGAGALLEQMRGHVANLDQHLAHAVFDSSRQPLARLLADAAALAGWQALDLGAIDQAWRFFETATRAAQQAGDTALYAFARVEQAHVLTELEQADAAADLAQSVWEHAHSKVAPGLRCWLSAATSELGAAAGHADESIAMLRRAESDAGSLGDALPPYLVFDQVHLERWIGHTLVLLGDPAAVGTLRQAADGMDPSFIRADASLRLDLASALRQQGSLEESAIELQKAEALARRVGSRRQLNRLRRLRSAS